MNQFEILMKAREDARSLHAGNETDKEIIAYNEKNERIKAELVETDEAYITPDDSTLVLTDENRPLTNAEKEQAVKLIIKFSDENAKSMREMMEQTNIAIQGFANLARALPTDANLSGVLQTALERMIEQAGLIPSLAQAACIPDTFTKAMLEMTNVMKSSWMDSLAQAVSCDSFTKAIREMTIVKPSLMDSLAQAACISDSFAMIGNDSLRVSELLANYAKGFDHAGDTLAKISFPRISIPSRTFDLAPIPYPIFTASPRRWSEPEARWERRELIAREVDPKVLDFISETLKRPDVKNHPVLSALLSMPFDALIQWATEQMKQSNGHSSIFVATYGMTAPAPSEQAATNERPTKPNTSDPLEKWFDYFAACKKARIRYTLKDLSADVHRAYGYIRQKHSEYRADKT